MAIDLWRSPPRIRQDVVISAGGQTATSAAFVLGDAQGVPTHDHFEWHPAGGPAVDPYPFLTKVC